jgi:hypothetical protein
VDQLPAVRLPKKGDFGLTDYGKVFCPDPATVDIYDLSGINRDTGCVVVVRPDQYVAHVLPLHGHQALSDFFAGILVDARYGKECVVMLTSTPTRVTSRSPPMCTDGFRIRYAIGAPRPGGLVVR